jgi:hypothetical protein
MSTYKFHKIADERSVALSEAWFLKFQLGIESENEAEVEALILAQGYQKVLVTEKPDDPYHYVVTGFEEIDGVLTTKLVRFNPERTDNELLVLAEEMKARRNGLLSASDWTQLPDVSLTTEMKQAWAVYRQALRDITSQEKFPWRIVWPEKPDNQQVETPNE